MNDASNPVREAIKRDLLRDEHNLLAVQMHDVRRAVEELKSENDRLRKANHEAEVVRRVLKWVLAHQVTTRRHEAGRLSLTWPTARGGLYTIPDVYEQTLFAVVREVELEAEHAG